MSMFRTKSHYLTLNEIGEYFKGHITKKELHQQTIGSTITLDSQQIVIIDDIRYSKYNDQIAIKKQLEEAEA